MLWPRRSGERAPVVVLAVTEDSHSNHVGHPHDDADDYRGSLEEASVWSEASEEDAPDKVLSAST